VRHDPFEPSVGAPHEALCAGRANELLGAVARDPTFVALQGIIIIVNIKVSAPARRFTFSFNIDIMHPR